MSVAASPLLLEVAHDPGEEPRIMSHSRPAMALMSARTFMKVMASNSRCVSGGKGFIGVMTALLEGLVRGSKTKNLFLRYHIKSTLSMLLDRLVLFLAKICLPALTKGSKYATVYVLF